MTKKELLIVPGVVSVDTETFYDKDYSIRDLGTYGYTHDPRFDCYLVSVFGYLLDGTPVRYVGHPSKFNWAAINGLIWLSHNKGFDHAVYLRLRELSPEVYTANPSAWHCTANMAVYLGAPRNLSGASLHLLGRKMDKTIRDNVMKGMKWAEAPEGVKATILEYALYDAENCYLLWAHYSDKWPEKERRLSESTYAMGDRGILVDIDILEDSIKALGKAMHAAELRIPWRNEHPLLSTKQFAAACRAIGIQPPVSMAMNNEDTDEWFERYGDKAPFAGAMRTWRRANALREKFRAMLARVKTDGRMAYSLLYMGGHTGRWSGSGGVNVQNQPRTSQYLLKSGALEMGGPLHRAISKRLAAGETVEELEYEINMRNVLVAPEEKKFYIVDYAQIEARVTPWLAGDFETLKLCEQGMSIYEVHARRFMGWTGGLLKKENPALYLLAKARVLALGFGAGHIKFLYMAGLYIDDPFIFDQIFGAAVDTKTVDSYIEAQSWQWRADDSDDEATKLRQSEKREAWLVEWQALTEQDRRYRVNAWLQVNSFRESNEKIVAVWKALDADLRRACERGETFTITLPSGRQQRYFDLTKIDGGIKARTELGGNFVYFYGGKLFENVVQATARDILAEAILRVEDAGITIVLHVHDEIVAEVPLEFDGKIIDDLMRIRPSWAQTLPIDVEGHDAFCYEK